MVGCVEHLCVGQSQVYEVTGPKEETNPKYEQGLSQGGSGNGSVADGPGFASGTVMAAQVFPLFCISISNSYDIDDKIFTLADD